MTCRKNCIHYEACKDIYYPMSTYDEEAKAFDESNSCDGCPFYSDASRFIELPCKVGDKYYTIDKYCTENGYYDEYKISSYSDCEYCVEQCDKQYRITEREFYNVINILQNESAIGKTVFLFREEAEKALKERDKEKAGKKE